jgi:hypothetical protein
LLANKPRSLLIAAEEAKQGGGVTIGRIGLPIKNNQQAITNAHHTRPARPRAKLTTSGRAAAPAPCQAERGLHAKPAMLGRKRRL